MDGAVIAQPLTFLPQILVLQPESKEMGHRDVYGAADLDGATSRDACQATAMLILLEHIGAEGFPFGLPQALQRLGRITGQ